jgi:hypothetical protein
LKIAVALGEETRSLDLASGVFGSAPTTPASASLLPRLQPGDCVGRYTVRALIGAGGMGEVFAAYDPELNRLVAVKILRPGIGGNSPEARVRFLREAQAMARLSHPNVVSVYDVASAGERVFVAMELVDGRTSRRGSTTDRTPGATWSASSSKPGAGSRPRTPRVSSTGTSSRRTSSWASVRVWSTSASPARSTTHRRAPRRPCSTAS